MKIVFDQDRPIVEADEIAALLELEVASFQELMRSEKIRSIVERGEGEDDGKVRLTFQSPRWRVRLTCAPDGEVLTVTRAACSFP